MNAGTAYNVIIRPTFVSMTLLDNSIQLSNWTNVVNETGVPGGMIFRLETLTTAEYSKFIGRINPCRPTTFTVTPAHNDADEINIFEIQLKFQE